MRAHDAAPGTGIQGNGRYIEGNAVIVPLPDLAAEINHEHDLAVQCAESALDHAYRAGELLGQAKTNVGHGGWLTWLAENCRVGARQAQRYMQLADARSKTTRVSHLSQRAALAELAAPAPEKTLTKVSTAPADRADDAGGDRDDRPDQWGDPTQHYRWDGAPESVKKFVQAVRTEHKNTGGNTRMFMLLYVLDLLDIEDEFARNCEFKKGTP